MELYPMRIEPKYDARIWGGRRLAEEMGKAVPPGETIGESWEIYAQNTVQNGAYAGRTITSLKDEFGAALMGHVPAGKRFPFLCKFIDAREALSVQVHPDDRFAQQLEGEANGKTECWYVLAADPGSRLTVGFERDMRPDEYEQLVQEGALEPALHEVPVQPGDVVYIPAGMVHAIGAGIVVYELQQTSDVTYRIYDWNRRDAEGNPRELHVDKARQVLDYHRVDRDLVHPLAGPEDRMMLVAGPYFTLESARGEGGFRTCGSPIGLTTLDHPLTVCAGGETVELPPYSSVLIPAAADAYTVHGGERFLVASVPASEEARREYLREWGIDDQAISAFLHQFRPVTGLGEPAI